MSVVSPYRPPLRAMRAAERALGACWRIPSRSPLAASGRLDRGQPREVQSVHPRGCPRPIRRRLGRWALAPAIANTLLAPWWRATSPRFFGTGGIPDQGPLLFVGNHTLMGVLDAPLMWLHLWRERGITLRALGDHTHFTIPLWRTALARFGVVDGTRENCARLMAAGEHILVFPGGGREVSKRKGEKYRLIWKERIGFARMAIEHRCTIVPFAAVGAEDMLDIVVDADELLAGPLGRVTQRLGIRSDVVWPIVKGRGPLPIPRAERLYFHFGDPIAPPESGGDDAARALRDDVRAAVEAGIELLLGEQRRDRALEGRRTA